MDGRGESIRGYEKNEKAQRELKQEDSWPVPLGFAPSFLLWAGVAGQPRRLSPQDG